MRAVSPIWTTKAQATRDDGFLTHATHATADTCLSRLRPAPGLVSGKWYVAREGETAHLKM